MKNINVPVDIKVSKVLNYLPPSLYEGVRKGFEKMAKIQQKYFLNCFLIYFEKLNWMSKCFCSFSKWQHVCFVRWTIILQFYRAFNTRSIFFSGIIWPFYPIFEKTCFVCQTQTRFLIFLNLLTLNIMTFLFLKKIKNPFLKRKYAIRSNLGNFGPLSGQSFTFFWYMLTFYFFLDMGLGKIFFYFI